MRAPDPDVAAAWLLTAAERGNPASEIDAAREDGCAWTVGNLVSVHVDGASYFARLHELLTGLGADDGVYLTDWRIDATRRLVGPGSELGPLLAQLARSGVTIRALLWRSHTSLVGFNLDANRVVGTTRSSWSSTPRTTRRAASRSSAGSTCPGAATTAPTTAATTTRCGSTRATAAGRPGTTCSWSCAGPPSSTST